MGSRFEIKFGSRFWSHGSRILTTGIFLILSLSVVSTVLYYDRDIQIASADSEPLNTDLRHMAAVITTSSLVNLYHYQNRQLNNEFSTVILDGYLTTLDPFKNHFLAQDVRAFDSNRFYFDDFLEDGNLDEIINIFRVYQERVIERAEFAKSILSGSFDFGMHDEIDLDPDNSQWAESREEYDIRWKRLVKDDVLELKLAEMNDDEIKTTLMQRYDRFSQAVTRYDADDVVELFLNSYLREIDPHSGYFSPHSSDNLKISISQQIEGIGAMLRTESEHTIVHSVITGGPAARTEKLNSGDKIVGVGNDQDTDFVDVIGWRLDDVVDLIRGPEGTTVYLKILPKDALPGSMPFELGIVRERVKLEEQMAKKSTVEISTDNNILRLGIISLPAFYSELFDNDSASTRNSSSDVRILLQELKEQEVDGIVMDLRGNGGGALHEAVALTGLFIETGPVVQVENYNYELDIRWDRDPHIAYEGPLAVLVDRDSASASEIFAGAMKDYRRGIVIGETTFGKGIVQTIWPLSRWTGEENSGAVKLSTAQFYRINGSSTQHLGVVPDIVFPTNDFVAATGERALENSLPGGSIDPVKSVVSWKHAQSIANYMTELRLRNSERTVVNPAFEYIVENERQSLARSELTKVHLNEDKRRKVLDDSRTDQLENLNKLRVSLGLEIVEEINEEAYPSERVGDVFLDEALNVLADLIVLNGSVEQQASVQQ